MRCSRPPCNREARLVVDLQPRKPIGRYLHFCWVCYFDWSAENGHPIICNFIDHGDRDERLQWDAQRERETLTTEN